MQTYYKEIPKNEIILKACFESSKNDYANSELFLAKNGLITEFLDKNQAYIYIEKDFKTYDDLIKIIDQNIISKANRDYVIDVLSFVNSELHSEDVVHAFANRILFYEAKLWNMKNKADEKKNFGLFISNDCYEELLDDYKIIFEARDKARSLQIMPENYCTSVMLAQYVEEDLKNIKGLKVTVLDQKQIEELKMGLLLSVNRGSTHEPRVVVIEYNGNPSSDKKISFVGKGITFDTGGMNTKGYDMEGMKFDMSGSAIVAYALKAMAQLQLKVNVAAVMCITDNRQDGDASLPENVYTSMSGKTVEVTDTDAEGRLVLADGIFYSAEKLKATTIVDVATLTGAVVKALGQDYSGVWSTSETNWKLFEKSAQKAHEKVWRMPLHDDFHEPNEASLVADLNNYNNDEKSDSNTAAMFLKQFTKDVPYIHCDVAGTADLSGKPQGVLVNTLVEFAKIYFAK
ncbi:M17 family metallopeptidase [Mycoplasmopsis opalescens]|uniref:M17 family metallopeptidase n=1 Tax=Mycoplasmopsis opalescens TaxID=114886 RepID=UPI0004A7356C|nr:M17 family metallopeptidase [Mycoplasmopsis opalescens]